MCSNIVLMLVGFLTACRASDTQVADASQTPSKQFILKRIVFEERIRGQLLWQGKADRVDGQYQDQDVQALTLTRFQPATQRAEFTLESPHATLALDQGQAHFEQAVVHTSNKDALHAGNIDYSEAKHHMLLRGPVVYRYGQSVIQAPRGVFDLKEQELVLEGPIEGEMQNETASD